MFISITGDVTSVSIVAFVTAVVFSDGFLAVPGAQASDVFLKDEAPGSISGKAYGTWVAMHESVVRKDKRDGLTEPAEKVAYAHLQSPIIGGTGYQQQISTKIFETPSTKPMRASRSSSFSIGCPLNPR